MENSSRGAGTPARLSLTLTSILILILTLFSERFSSRPSRPFFAAFAVKSFNTVQPLRPRAYSRYL